jgi:hypothetical protein
VHIKIDHADALDLPLGAQRERRIEDANAFGEVSGACDGPEATRRPALQAPTSPPILKGKTSTTPRMPRDALGGHRRRPPCNATPSEDIDDGLLAYRPIVARTRLREGM